MSVRLFLKNALEIEPRLFTVDFDLTPIMDEHDTAFISGSVPAGFGNKSSDVDIYVISDKNPLLPNGLKFGYTNLEHGYYNEVIVFTNNYIKELCSKINNNQYDVNNSEFLLEMEHYYRCAIGVPLLNSEKFFETVRDFSTQIADAAYAQHYLSECKNKLRTLLLLIKYELFELTVDYAKLSAEHAIDYLLAKNGEGYESRKFRFLKLEKLCERNSDLYKQCWQIQFKGKRSSEDYANDVFRFCTELGISVIFSETDDLIFALAGNISQVDMLGNFIVFNGNDVFSVKHECLMIIDSLSIAPSSYFCLQKLFYKEQDFKDALEELLYNGVIKIV